MQRRSTGSSSGANSDSLLMQVARRWHRRWALLCLALVVLMLMAGGIWQRERARASRALDSAPAQGSWTQGLVLVPSVRRPRPPQDAGSGLKHGRLAVFASEVNELLAGTQPLLVAFGSEELRAKLELLLGSIDERAVASVHIRELGSGRVLFDYFGDTALNPASNQKLVTSSAALDLLGPDYVFETRALRVEETLYLVGGGDPTLDTDALMQLAAEVAERTAVTSLAEIVVDDSAFSSRTFGPGYASDGPGHSYMAPSGALSLNFNTVEVVVYPIKGGRRPAVKVLADSPHLIVSNEVRYGSGPTRLELRSAAEIGAEFVDEPAPPRSALRTRLRVMGQLGQQSTGVKLRRRVVDPGLYTGGAFAQMLAEVSDSEPLPVRLGLAPTAERGSLEPLSEGDLLELPRVLDDEGRGTLVAVRHSAPLHEIVGRLLTYSNNFIAEQLLRTLGWELSGEPGNWVNGSEVLRAYWQAVGNDAAELVFENGSGLSERGRVSSAGLVDLMVVGLATQAPGERLVDALPVAGTVGTLGARLQKSGKRVRAKTGTLDGAGGLTGVITDEEGEPQVVFSILINAQESSHVGASTRRSIEDAVVMAVLEHIDGWEAIRGTLILDLEPIVVERTLPE